MLRTSRPAPISRTTEVAISPATSTEPTPAPPLALGGRAAPPPPPPRLGAPHPPAQPQDPGPPPKRERGAPRHNCCEQQRRRIDHHRVEAAEVVRPHRPHEVHTPRR